MSISSHEMSKVDNKDMEIKAKTLLNQLVILNHTCE